MVTASERIDTVIGKIDTILVKNIGQTDNCVASHDVSTNGYDVMIVFSICVTSIIIFILLVYFVFKIFKAHKEIENLNKTIDTLTIQANDKDKEIKQLNDELTKAKEELETKPVADTTLKDLKNIKLKFLEKYTKDYGERESFDSEECQKFLSYIDGLIKEDSEITSDK